METNMGTNDAEKKAATTLANDKGKSSNVNGGQEKGAKPNNENDTVKEAGNPAKAMSEADEEHARLTKRYGKNYVRAKSIDGGHSHIFSAKAWGQMGDKSHLEQVPTTLPK